MLSLFSLLSTGQVNTGDLFVDAKMAAIPAYLTTSLDGIAAYVNANFKLETDKINLGYFGASRRASLVCEKLFN